MRSRKKNKKLYPKAISFFFTIFVIVFLYYYDTIRRKQVREIVMLPLQPGGGQLPPGL